MTSPRPIYTPCTAFRRRCSPVIIQHPPQGFGAAAPAETPLLTDLVAYWDLDETSGTRADSHTNALDLTDNNTVTSGLGVDGVSAAAEFVHANSEYLSRASEASIQAGDVDFTFAAWVRVTSAGGDQLIVSKTGTAATPTIEYDLRIAAALNAVVFGYYNGTGWRNLTLSGLSMDATWVFVVGWYDKTAATVNLQTDNGTPSSFSVAGQPPAAAGAGAFNVGRYELGGGNTINGRMQSLGYWKRVLTADERTWLYNSGAAARTYAAVAAYTG